MVERCYAPRMSVRDDLLRACLSNPAALREAFEDPVVKKALDGIGVGGRRGIEVAALHAPAPSARTATGRGQTLCGLVAIRHEAVTCTRCAKKLAR